MRYGMHFAALRLIVLSLAVLCQVYLFVRIRQAIRSLRLSNHLKFLIINLVGVAIGLLFAMNFYILSKPIPWADPPVAVQAILFYFPAIWGFGSIFSALLLGLIQVAGWFKRRFVRLHSGPGSIPLNLNRRRFVQAAVGGVAAAPLILSGYEAVHAGQAYEIRELTVPFGRTLRVVQLTDIHAGLYMTQHQMRHYVDEVIALQPDLFVLTGDFITNSMQFLPGCVAEMARVRARYGTFATLGNHEYWYGDLNEIQAIFRKCRIPLLRNAHRIIQTGRGPFAVAGIDDLRAGDPDLKAALRGLNSDIPTLLLSHRPEIFPQAAAHEIPLTLAGHYHGGQIKLSLRGRDISPAHFMTPYPEGLHRINASRLYVSRGIGTTFTPVRLNVPPEITLLHLT